MTEPQAHEFIAKWSNRWLGCKPLNETDAVRRVKASCRVPIFSGLFIMANDLPRILYPTNIAMNGETYLRMGLLVFGLGILTVSAWLLVQLWRACKVIGMRF